MSNLTNEVSKLKIDEQSVGSKSSPSSTSATGESGGSKPGNPTIEISPANNDQGEKSQDETHSSGKSPVSSEGKTAPAPDVFVDASNKTFSPDEHLSSPSDARVAPSQSQSASPSTDSMLSFTGGRSSKVSTSESSRPPSPHESLSPNDGTSSLHRKGKMSSAPSFLELKRFFGKGHKRHEHGVSQEEANRGTRGSMYSSDSSTRRSNVFNFFGSSDPKQERERHERHERERRERHERHEKERTERHERHKRHEREKMEKHEREKRNKIEQEKIEREKHGNDTGPDTLGNYFLGPLLHMGKKKSDTSGKGLGPGKYIDAESGLKVKVKGRPPADLDPNFVVHAPDYEAEWDPFHLFGQPTANSEEKLPFLESRIAKYGEMGQNVGSGAGGSVRTIERPSDHKIFAVKEFRARRSTETPQKYAKHVAAEYALGAALHQKNIIETIDLIKEGDKYYEVMEYGPHDFFELVMSGTMTTAQVNSSFAQILTGVAYLHSLGVAHRDLKLDNCVVTNEGVVKIIDFGSSVIFKYPMSPQIHLARGIMGSDPYLAPEVFYRHPYQPQYVDVWSCGIIYACTYMRRFPWKLPQKEDNSFRKFAANATNITGQPGDAENPKKITGPWRLLRLLPAESRHLISQMLKIPVSERIDMEHVVQDPWYKSIDQISVLPPKSEKSEQQKK